MKRLVLSCVLPPLLLSSAFAQNIAAPSGREFLDVPPCHFAYESVQRLARAGLLVGFPTTPAELAGNAVRQVFEGLKCGDAAYTARFLSGAPATFAARVPDLGAPLRPGFEFEVLSVRISGDAATVSYRVRFRGGSNVSLVAREGAARLVRDERTGWRVEYASLAGLPFFPGS